MVYTAGFLGGNEVLLILIVVLLIFGGRKIPELARGLGKGIRDFKKATEESDLTEDIKDVVSEIKDVKEGVEKMNPKNMLKTDTPSKSAPKTKKK